MAEATLTPVSPGVVSLSPGACYVGDNLQLLPLLAPGSVDAVVTDPPFGIASETKVSKVGQELQPFNIEEWDLTLPLEWIPKAAAAMRPGASIVVFTDANATHLVRDAMVAAGLHFLQNVYWHRVNPPPQPRNNFQSAISAAVFAVKPGKRLWWGGGGHTPNFIAVPLSSQTETVGGLRHPTQKPLALIRVLVRLLVPPGGLVLDPFMGSGTLAEAAVREGRQWLGMELDPKWVAMTEKRLRRATPPLPEMADVPTTLAMEFDDAEFAADAPDH